MEIVLTASKALMSDYNGTNYMGFLSALPANLMKEGFSRFFFPTYSDRNGRATVSNYSIAKIEAALLREFSREEVIIADPRKLDEVVKEDTKTLGITCMDPLGVGFGSGIANMALTLLGKKPRPPSYMSKSFLDILNHPKVKKYKPKIIVGGSASWQFLDFNIQDELGIDTVVLGEGEDIAVEIFDKAMRSEELPKVVNGSPVRGEEIPPIVTPSIGGEVEITRGCDRGCRFCTTNSKFRTIPIETIMKEVKLNLKSRERTICLHSEDFLRYGSNSLIPEEKEVLKLFEKVSKLCSAYDADLSTDFVTAVSVVANPELAIRIGKDYVNKDRKSFIEVGIETSSSKLIKRVMDGKVKPFDAERYPEIVKEAIEILNEGGWTVVGTLITKLPGETEEDVIKSIELVDDMKDLDVMIFVLPFIPMGRFRGRDEVIIKKVIENDLRRELFLKGLEKAVMQAKKDIDVVKSGIRRSLIAKFSLWFGINYALRKVRGR